MWSQLFARPIRKARHGLGFLIFVTVGLTSTAEADQKLVIWHSAPVREIIFLANGNSFLAMTGSPFEATHLWETKTGKQGASIAKPDWQLPGYYGFSSADLSDDGKVFATGCGDGDVRLWDVTTQKELYQFVGSRDKSGLIPSVDLSADGQHLAACDGRWVYLWNLKNKGVTLTMDQQAYCVRFSPDGKVLACGGYGGLVLRDPETGQKLKKLAGNYIGDVRTISFSPDGELLAIAQTSELALLWNVKKDQLQHELNADAGTNLIVFSPTGKVVASVATGDVKDCAIILWNATNGKEIGRLHTPGEYVSTMAFSPDGGYLAAGNYDQSLQTLRLWDVERKKELWSKKVPVVEPSSEMRTKIFHILGAP